MKRILLLLSFSLSLLTLAQTPKTISYQGVARNATGQPIPNQSIKIKLSLLETATSLVSLYSETHTLTTTGQGLFALQIGAGTVLNGTYTNLDWSNGPAFVKTEIDPSGGDNFSLSSTNPLNAVPFALFAASGTPGPRGLKGDTGAIGPQGPAGVGLIEGTTVGQMLFWNGSSWITLNPGTAGQALTMCNGLPTWTTNGVCPASNLATLTTTTISSITLTTAISGGNISNDGGGSITQRGVVWSTSQNPTIVLTTKTNSGPGSGSFTSNMTGLSPNTVYYVRAYATNSAGTAYGNQLNFTSAPPVLPSLTTTAVSTTASTTAISGGTINNDGGGTITARGVVWSTSQNPTTALTTKTVDGTGVGNSLSTISGLSPNTLYYIRAYATNTTGTAYGNQVETRTGVSLTIETSLIPAGTFMIGSPASEQQRDTNEVQHQVTLSAFRMSKYEVNNEQYAAFLNAKGIGSNGLYAGGAYPTQALVFQSDNLTWSGTQWEPLLGKENFPVAYIPWYGALEFATYSGGRLPTEAEWEYACRGNLTTPFSTGNCLSNTQANYQWSTPLTGCTNTITSSPGQTQPVNSYLPNSYGLYNMHGNIWEWCADWYGAYPNIPQSNPTGPANGSKRVVRGGSWYNDAGGCRSAIRYSWNLDGVILDFGFRVAFAP